MTELRHDWSREEIQTLFALPFNDLLFQAHTLHRRFFDPNRIQISSLLSIKTGSCPEDCKYCPQSAHYTTGLQKEKLLLAEQVVAQAKAARDAGATRFCMGAAWRAPSQRDLPLLLDMVRSVKALGMETCMTLGMLTADQAQSLAQAGLDYYNHNLDTSENFYSQIISTRSYQDRLDTLQHVRDAGMKICCGGILGMGEAIEDRIDLLRQLAALQPHPESVPLNLLMRIPGTPLADADDLPPLEFVRVIAVARILMPAAQIRLSAGREVMDDTTQALAFFAGANSVFYGEKLLTAANPDADRDRQLFARLGLHTRQQQTPADETLHEAALLDLLAEEQAPFQDAMREPRKPRPCGLTL